MPPRWQRDPPLLAAQEKTSRHFCTGAPIPRTGCSPPPLQGQDVTWWWLQFDQGSDEAVQLLKITKVPGPRTGVWGQELDARRCADPAAPEVSLGLWLSPSGYDNPDDNPFTFSSDIALLKLVTPAASHRVSAVWLPSEDQDFPWGAVCYHGLGKTSHTGETRLGTMAADPSPCPAGHQHPLQAAGGGRAPGVCTHCRKFWGSLVTDVKICTRARGVSSCSAWPLGCAHALSHPIVGS
ncbi:PREDICTED: chymotrypsinogen 2-like [Chinchilla lanigera]|uniref:chymotrypsinogen 2-like n=1 Tax=Chinchilla lanigera TaxID=34839 RepID=UPI00038EA673|nr:PREDICTED: chymotrypsinogen 2-like [Chinchilla lanigera]